MNIDGLWNKSDIPELANTLRTVYGPIIKEADDYRPLASYIIALLDLCRSKK